MSIWHSKVRQMFIGVVTKEIKPADFLQEYRSLVDDLVSCRNRLKNPVNLKNGKPLAQSTVLGFENRIDALKSELKHYRPVFKLLRLFGYFVTEKMEFSTEQEVLKYFLQKYVDNEALIHSWRKDRLHDAEYWKEKAENYKFIAEEWKSTYKDLSAVVERFGIKQTPERKAIVYPFPVIDGGKKL